MIRWCKVKFNKVMIALYRWINFLISQLRYARTVVIIGENKIAQENRAITYTSRLNDTFKYNLRLKQYMCCFWKLNRVLITPNSRNRTKYLLEFCFHGVKQLLEYKQIETVRLVLALSEHNWRNLSSLSARL